MIRNKDAVDNPNINMRPASLTATGQLETVTVPASFVVADVQHLNFVASEGFGAQWNQCPFGDAGSNGSDSYCGGVQFPPGPVPWDVVIRADGVTTDTLGNSIGMQVGNVPDNGSAPFGDQLYPAHVLTGPNGSAGGLFRHYHKPTVGGSGGSGGCGMRTAFSATHPELYFRWYNRWLLNPSGVAGVTWTGATQQKIVYINVGSFVCFVIPGLDTATPNTQYHVHVSSNSANVNLTANLNTSLAQFTHFGDGNWHLFDLRLKTDTNGSNGIVQLWIDGTQVMDYSSVDFNSVLWEAWVLGSNSFGLVANMWTDYAHPAVGTLGRIGAYDALRGY